MKRVRELFQTEGKLRERIPSDNARDRPGRELSHHQTRLPSEPLSLVFENVSFGYEVPSKREGDRPASPGDNGHAPAGDNGSTAVPKERVLHDLSFHLRPGRVLGLLGRTGSGKTTLTRLIFRLYDPDDRRHRAGCRERV